MQRKVSDLIAEFFERKGVKHAFGIIGSANAHIFDSIFYQSKIELICPHHEQACTMAIQSYWKVSGQPTFALVTAGAGSSNAITGVLSAWADSIPCLIISGQENARYVTPGFDRRMYGIQGYDSPFAVSKMTKYGARVMTPEQTLYELEKAWHIATTGRPGPCWIDFPQSVQSAMVKESTLAHYTPEAPPTAVAPLVGEALQREVVATLTRLRGAKRPLLWLGVGIRMAGAQKELKAFVEALGVPVLVTWSAIDLLPGGHPLVMGSAGVYGQRAANFILQSCDCLVTIGTRLAIPQVGYDISELARAAKDITVVDIDPTELKKYPERFNHPVRADAGGFIRELQRQAATAPLPAPKEWLAWCGEVRARFPWIGPEHADKDGFINSYKFMDRLVGQLKPDQVVVTDMGTALLSGHQALRITPPQRLITSQGLGEMGFGLPGAIGASFARNRGEVLCLNCDGGMMMNLQELQTVAHHQLPIKLIIFNNDGYLMIKHTQKAVLKGRYAGTDAKSGVSCPDFSKLATAFGMPAFRIRTWEDFDREMPKVLAAAGPVICEVFMAPEQFFHPKLGISVQPDGTLISPPLEDLSPFLPRETLRANLQGPLHPKSEKIQPG
ncbi:thiamine pyrophosphate-binding protein [Opitutus sp. GAS368]|uniref:thiamine pyrophosphate-binding protein n=1 Tax=Opitutus sp. GAS368 TaxID=1882749 RepID=UPI00087A7FA3|nr:thiamine pyrophosphate-binding protein [Opitutus sp. GAS368]SDS08736.1 acetolactate synthase-1/2/3 large subunit [Opitutus sp. GAS368]